MTFGPNALSHLRVMNLAATAKFVAPCAFLLTDYGNKLNEFAA